MRLRFQRIRNQISTAVLREANRHNCRVPHSIYEPRNWTKLSLVKLLEEELADTPAVPLYAARSGNWRQQNSVYRQQAATERSHAKRARLHLATAARPDAPQAIRRRKAIFLKECLWLRQEHGEVRAYEMEY